MTGRVLKAVGGFWYIHDGTETHECRARGLFRKEGQSPLPGDLVDFDREERCVISILPRKNSLIRPAVANVDRLVIVTAATRPEPIPLFLDRLICLAERQRMEPVLCVNKCDLRDGVELAAVYRQAGFQTVCVSAGTGEGLDGLRRLLEGQVCVFCGSSGVGKSSLMNRLLPGVQLDTGSVAAKTGRGRHTTRYTELFPAEGGFVADTPGFTDLEFTRDQPILREELPLLFREFEPHLGACRYPDCAHLREPDCGVRTAVARGLIAQSRYDSYAALYEEVRELREWQFRQK